MIDRDLNAAPLRDRCKCSLRVILLFLWDMNFRQRSILNNKKTYSVVTTQLLHFLLFEVIATVLIYTPFLYFVFLIFSKTAPTIF